MSLSRIARFVARARRPEKAAVNIVAFGDSVTQGAMELGVLKPKAVYHYLLQEALESFFPVTTFNTINSGVSGETTLQAGERLECDVLCHRPDLVLVAFGLNDSVDGVEAIPVFKDRLSGFVREIYQQTSAAVVLLSPPAMATKKSARIHPKHESVADLLIDIQTSGVMKKYAEAVGEVAAENETLFADIYTAWERLREDGFDCDTWIANGLNHPDERGHSYAHTVLWRALFEKISLS